MEVYSVRNQGIDGYAEPRSLTDSSQKQGRVKELAEPQPNKVAEVKRDQRQMPKTNEGINPKQHNYPKMIEIAQKVRAKLESIHVNIQFEVNRELGRIIIKVIDPASGEVVRKIPPEKFMKSVEFLNDMKKELHLEGIEVDVKY